MTQRGDLTIEQRVAASALLLDVERPGWAKEINLEKFSLKNPCDCIVGQLVGNFYYNFEKFAGDPKDRMFTNGKDNSNTFWAYAQAAWEHEITVRL